MVLPSLIVVLSLAVDRGIGDPHTPYHPVALLGRFIGWWGRPGVYPPWLQRSAGVGLWLFTALLFSLPFLLLERFAPWYLLLLAGPFFLKVCIGWRSLEDHARAVLSALDRGIGEGKREVQMLVSRDTSHLDREQILSATYESVAENLVDSILAPLLYFGIGSFLGAGLFLAALYRAANTMDAMLGYRDERARLGWWAARADDTLNYIPARIAGVILLFYFLLRHRAKEAWRTFRQDARKRPGWNGGIPMALIAGGTGVAFEKPGVYRIGHGERTLAEAGWEVVRAVQGSTLLGAALLVIALCLLRPVSYV